MFKNRFKITVRSLLKYKQYSLINLLGLAIGLSCFILITIWVQDELSYDRFHQNADNIHIVFRNDKQELSGATSQLLASSVKDEIPEIVNATSFSPLPETYNIFLKYKEHGFNENFTLTDSEFFKIFSFPFVRGQVDQAFQDPNSIVLTERVSKKYFGDENPLGKVLELTFVGQTKLMKVTGVINNIPSNSSINRELFIPIDFINDFGANWDTWRNRSPETYILTSGPVNTTDLEAKIIDCKQKHYKEENVSYTLMPLKKVHLHTSNISFFSSNGDIKYVYIFSAIAAIILLMACMNYINLSNSLSLKRAKEIGVKKVVGAGRKGLFLQYIGETTTLTLVALGIAILLVTLLLPFLNELAGKSLKLDVLNPRFLLTIVFTIVVTGLISGLYPAVFISSFEPVKILKGKLDVGSKNFSLRKALIIFQFTLSVAIIISTIVVMNQLNFIRNAKLGYDKENVLCINVKNNIWNNYEAFKNQLLQYPDITNISRSEPLNSGSMGKTEGMNWEGKKDKLATWVFHVDNDFLDTYKIEMKEGRFYSDQYPSDKVSAYVLNEAAMKKMGLEDPIGMEINFWGRKGKIIGVAKDFNFSSLHHTIESMVLRIPDPEETGKFYRSLSIRLKPNSTAQSLHLIEQTWNTFYPDQPMDYYFFDESLANNYLKEYRMGTLFKYFSILAIFISCLGLYGLTAFSIEQQFKTIGIYKVLGAKVSNVVLLFTKNYMWWIVVANLISWPLTYYIIINWLEKFAYRINLGIWPFLISGVLVMGIAVITIGWLAIRAALQNPVDALRYE